MPLPVLLGLAAGGGWLLNRIQVPVGWLLGAMAVGVGSAWWHGAPRPVSAVWQITGHVLLALSAGIAFPLGSVTALGTYFLPLVLLVIVTVGLSLLNGYLLWRWAGVDRATGLMGSLPGAASTMVAMSAGVGADGLTVAVLQYLRLIIVVFLAPAAVHWLFGAAAGPAPGMTGAAAGLPAPAAPLIWNLPALAGAGLAGLLAGRVFRLPAPTFLGPFLATVALAALLPWRPYVPDPLFAAGLVLMGTVIGARFDVALARQLGRAALVSSVLVCLLVGLCLGVGYLFHLATGMDTVTAVLGSTPGGMEVMVASAVELGGDPGLVLAMQMVRWFLVLLAGPWLARRLGGGAAG